MRPARAETLALQVTRCRQPSKIASAHLEVCRLPQRRAAGLEPARGPADHGLDRHRRITEQRRRQLAGTSGQKNTEVRLGDFLGPEGDAEKKEGKENPQKRAA